MTSTRNCSSSIRFIPFRFACEIMSWHRGFLIFVWLVFFYGLQSHLYSQEDLSGSISGTVLSENHSSVSAFINIFRLIPHNGFFVPRNECTQTIESNGAFNCASLPSGYYVATVNILGCPFPKSLNSTLNLSCPRIIVYPQNADGDPSNLMRLQRGEALTLNLEVADAPETELHTTKASSRGIDKWHLYWEVGGASIPIEMEASHETKRTFMLSGLPQATIRIVENWYLNDIEHEASAIIMTAQNSSYELALSEQPSYSVLGHIRHGVKPMPKVEEIACGDVQKESRAHFSIFIESDGSFTAKHVSPGLYNCILHGPEGLVIKSITQENKGASSTLLDLQHGAPAPLTLEVDTSTTRIAGILKNSTSGAAEILVRNMDTETTKIAKTDVDGRFELFGLLPGTYKLYGWTEIDTIPYENRDFLRHYDEKSTEISIGQNSSISTVEVDCLNCTL